jgi:hypothetical protein
VGWRTHPNGRIYVGGAWSGNVVVYENGKLAAEIKGLSSRHDLEIAADGDIWLSDSGNNRMLLLSPDLEIKKELKGEPYNFNGVRGLLADGTLVAGDKYTHTVKFIGMDGAMKLVRGTPGNPGKGENVFRTPEGIEVRGGTLWNSDSGNDRVVNYRLSP